MVNVYPNAIILSGLPGSGKSVLGDSLVEKYNFEKHSIGDLWRKQYKTLYPDEKISFEEFWKETMLEDNVKINEEARKILEKKIAKNSKIIIEGRYTIPFASLPVFSVFVTCNLSVRAERALNGKKYKGRSKEKIEEILKEREQDELNMGKKMFGDEYDYRDRKYYDLYLDSGKMKLEEEVSEALNSIDFG
ncbi:MAG: AAA family ATPase [Candidatus Aenigmarchaeota archaeon]|nr:AAA family ATPase [Candidatus Aenigmarchaeota archaeon]